MFLYRGLYGGCGTKNKSKPKSKQIHIQMQIVLLFKINKVYYLKFKEGVSSLMDGLI